MTQLAHDKLDELGRLLAGLGEVAVAVSGGVDSLTMACVAHQRLGANATMFHAVSPAVPPEATERTRRHARQFGWRLEIMDAGEFRDPEYLRTPVNRCFHCKANLYGAIAERTRSPIISVTNLNDLADFRPGLEAAKNSGVLHPYVECGIDKALVRTIAAILELGDTADLPASPCLSSRVETGIRVTAERLGLVHAVEGLVRRSLVATVVRCRIRRDGLQIELDEGTFRQVTASPDGALRSEIERLGAARGHPGPVHFACYRMGSAFLRE
jgi:uncharacterized protein